jgi:hypothetical protein
MSNGSTSNLLRFYSHKEVAFRYNGCGLSFFLSHGLFSSYAIDAGTSLLLKLIAQHKIAEGKRSLIDIGCGAGVIGLSIKKRHPEINATLQDRDALAVAFSQAAARRNGLLPDGAEESPDLRFAGALAFEGQEGRTFDLIVSNWPAKAGIPVLKEFFFLAAASLEKKGDLAMVVVRPLKEQALAFALEAGWEVQASETTANHCAFLASLSAEAPKQHSPTFSLSPYLRGIFKGKGYQMESVYGLPGFDTIAFHHMLFASELAKVVECLAPEQGTTLIRNPGQGHIPLILAAEVNKQERKLPLPIRLASRDRLQLLISSRNLQKAGIPHIIEHDASPILDTANEETKASLAIMDIDYVPGSDICKETWLWADQQLLPTGLVLFLGKSALIGRIADGAQGFSLIHTKKYKGYRLLLFSKN